MNFHPPESEQGPSLIVLWLIVLTCAVVTMGLLVVAVLA
jgi:hypothetical protein